MPSIVYQNPISSPCLEHNKKKKKSLDSIHANPSEPSSEKNKLSTSSTSASSSFSLALCTEHLGNETGSDDTMAGVFLSPAPPRSEVLLKQESRKKESRTAGGTMIKIGTFPPPLTTVSSLRMRRHREDGRLIIEASSRDACLHAERSGGRLRLCYLTTTSTVGDDGEERGEEEEEEIHEPRSEIESEKEEGFDGEKSMEKGSCEKYQWWSTSRCKEEEGGGGSHGNHLFGGWPLPSY